MSPNVCNVHLIWLTTLVGLFANFSGYAVASTSTFAYDHLAFETPSIVVFAYACGIAVGSRGSSLSSNFFGRKKVCLNNQT